MCEFKAGGTVLGAPALLAPLALVVLLSLAGPAAAQGKIVCWKDKAGKVVGCGDKVPPEFQSSATKELDARGVTRKTTESVEEASQRKVREQEAARVRAEEDRRILDQKRQDTALLETYSNEKEIDLKRDRDLSNIDLQMEQLNTSLKGATQRYNDAKSRAEATEKNKKAPSQALKDELARAMSDKQRLEQNLANKQKEKDELRNRYAEYKRRFNELRSASPAPVAAKK
jgi:hypothetical protein